MNNIPSFEFAKFTEKEGMLTPGWSSNLNQLLLSLQSFQKLNPSATDAITPIVNQITPDQDYLADATILTVFSLPSNCNFGQTFVVINKNTGGWTLTIGAGQTIQLGAVTGTTALSSSAKGDCATLKCINQNKDFIVISHEGALSLS